MTSDFVRDNILLFGPGFIFTKLIYLFAQQHRRLEWEWVIWSLITGVPIALAAMLPAVLAWPAFVQTSTAPFMTDKPWVVSLRFAIAVGAGLSIAWAWRRFRFSSGPVRFVRRALSDSAWDLLLDTAHSDACAVEVTVPRTDDNGETREAAYYGKLAAFGYEAASAEPIVALSYVSRWIGVEGYVKLGRDQDKVVFHRDKIVRMRLLMPPPDYARATETSGLPSADPIWCDSFDHGRTKRPSIEGEPRWPAPPA